MLKLLLFFAPLFLFSSPEKEGIRGELHITVRGVHTAVGGEIWVGIFTKATQNTRSKKEYLIKQIEVRHNDLITVVFDDLPEGKYEVTLFHDKNRNGKLDKSFFGTPSEGHLSSETVFAVNGAECRVLEVEMEY